MIRKPWPIIFISLVFFLIPIFNIINTYFIIGTDFPFFDYIYSLTLIPKNYLHLFDMIVPSFVAGIAVYCVKKWSYPVFLTCMLWITTRMFITFSSHWSFWEITFSLFVPMVINILYVSYVLLPNMRAAYINPRLRWWETKPRYFFSTNIEIFFNDKTILGQISNISEGGLYCVIPTSIEPNSLVKVKFTILGSEIKAQAKIVYRKPDEVSHGVQFFNIPRAQKKRLKKIMARLANENYEAVRPVPVWTEDLAKWFKTLIKTGKGFVPDIPSKN